MTHPIILIHIDKRENVSKTLFISTTQYLLNKKLRSFEH